MSSTSTPIRMERWFQGRALLLLSAPESYQPNRSRAQQAITQTVLIVLPPGPEQSRSYRLLRELATKLAASGVPVLRVALSGTAHTTPHSAHVTLADWHSDIISAAIELRRRWPRASLTGLGVRFGTRLLVDALPCATLALAPEQTPQEQTLDRLVAWSPLFLGSDWLDHLRAVEGQMRKAGQQLDSDDLAGSAWSTQLRTEVGALTAIPPLPAATTLVLDADQELNVGNQNNEYNQKVNNLSSSDWCASDLPMMVAGDASSALYSALSGQRQVLTNPDTMTTDSTNGTARPLSAALRADPPGTSVADQPFSLGGSVLAPELSAPGDDVIEQGLFGIFRSGKTACPVVVMLNSGLLPCDGPYGVYAEIAESLAQSGIASVRFDSSGKGESPRKPLSAAQTLLDDYAQVCDFLRQQGHQQTILLGICSGADDALEIAEKAENVAGLVLLDGYAPKTQDYTRHYLRQFLVTPSRLIAWLKRKARSLFSARVLAPQNSGQLTSNSASNSTSIDLRRWESAQAMQDRYRAVLNTPCPTLALFTGALEYDYYNHAGQLSKALGQPAELTERYYPAMSHLYPASSQREELLRQLNHWTSRTFNLPANQQT